MKCAVYTSHGCLNIIVDKNMSCPLSSFSVLLGHMDFHMNTVDCLKITASFKNKLFNNRGIKHDFPFINIRKGPREVLKTEGVARCFQPARGTLRMLRMLMNDKIMFGRYYWINSANNCENEENIGTLYFITSSHFPTRVRF